jgi:hypothetical protein
MRDGLAEWFFLLLRGTPAAVDGELDAVVSGIRCSSMQGVEERRVQVGYPRDFFVKDRRAIGDATITFVKGTAEVTARDLRFMVLTAKDVDKR